MRIEDYFQILYNQVSTNKHEYMDLTVEELSSLFYCTTRNTKNLLKQMQQLNWVEWVPGKGRGNKSKCKVLIEMEDIQLHKAKQLVEEGKLDGAIQYVREQFNLSYTQQFFNWLNTYFGSQNQIINSEQIDTLRIPYYREIQSLDPLFAHQRMEVHMVKQVFDPLVKFDSTNQSIKPHLAHYWETDKTGKNWTFHLRKGVFFHHGVEFTSYDVEFTLNRLRELDNPYQWLCSSIEKITILSKYCIEIKLEVENHFFLDLLACNWMSIVPRDLGKREDFARLPCGTGPFQIFQNEHAKLILKAYDSYFLGRSFLDFIELWIIPDDHANKHFDIESQEIKNVKLSKISSHDYVENQHLENGGAYITFNLFQDGPQRDIRFRQAVHYLLNRKEMVQLLGGERHSPSSSFLPNRYTKDYTDTYDFQKALNLVKQVTFHRSLRLYTYENNLKRKDVEWISQKFTQAEIPHTVHILSIEEFMNPNHMREADMILTDAVFEENMAFSLFELYQSDNSFIRNHIGAAHFQQLKENLDQVIQTRSKEEQIQKLLDMEAFIKADHLVLFLYHYQNNILINPLVKGVTFNSLGWIDFKDIWLDITKK